MSHWRGQKLKSLVLISSAVALISAALLPGHALASCAAPTDIKPCQPYFKVFGSDVFAGGSFIDQNGFCNTGVTSNYQDFSSAVGGKRGGIMAFAKPTVGAPQGGASSQYGVLSLGNVDFSAINGGFYSNSANSTTIGNVSSLTFSNSLNGQWGGDFQGAANGIRQSHCIPDYYSKEPKTNVTNLNDALVVGGGLTASTASGNYRANPTGTPGSVFQLNSSPVSLATDKKITIYSTNPVYIGADISYVAGADTSHVPKLALIVKGGSINIGPNVKNLDGLYIAQPDTLDSWLNDTGEIWSCHNNTSDPSAPSSISTSYIYNNCRLPILAGQSKCLQMANGALIAKQINFTRVVLSDVVTAATSEDSLAGAQSACTNNNIGEVVNYSPLMTIGGGFFNPTDKPPFNIESLVSMPPTL